MPRATDVGVASSIEAFCSWGMRVSLRESVSYWFVFDDGWMIYLHRCALGGGGIGGCLGFLGGLFCCWVTRC
jgi:hypothetical protein